VSRAFVIGGARVVLLLVWLAAGSAAAEPVGSVALADPSATPSQRVVAEAEWAEELAHRLGLDAVLPPEPDIVDVFTLLCADRAERTLAAGGRQLPEDGSFRVAFEAPRPSNPYEPIRQVVSVPATALYQLTVEGTGAQRWVIDSQPVGHLDASPLGVAQTTAVVPLREGPHEVSGFLVADARVDRVEIAAYRSLCIAPADGWRSDRPLRHGALARTLVRTFDLERRLPRRGGEVRIQGERFESATQGGGATGRRLESPAAEGSWASALASPAEFTWGFRLEEPAVVSVSARTHGVQPQLWSLDGHYRLTIEPESVPGDFTWNHVVTLPVSAGRHALRALVGRGAGIDEIRMVFHDSRDSDYAQVLAGIGFPTGAPSAPVTRGELREVIEHPAFAQLASGFQRRAAGDLSDRSLVLVDDDAPGRTSRPLSPALPAEL
jgi:hypothetical protein